VNKEVHQMKGASTKALNVKKGLKIGVNIKQQWNNIWVPNSWNAHNPHALFATIQKLD
jgi:hypothetical protein